MVITKTTWTPHRKSTWEMKEDEEKRNNIVESDVQVINI